MVAGTAVEELDGWKMTQEMVRSTMPKMKSQFTGMSPIGGSRDNYVDAYRAWREVGPRLCQWSYMPLSKDPEVFPSEGYLIKTRGGNNVSTTIARILFLCQVLHCIRTQQDDIEDPQFQRNECHLLQGDSHPHGWNSHALGTCLQYGSVCRGCRRRLLEVYP